jgi:predicted transcriptional regulator
VTGTTAVPSGEAVDASAEPDGSAGPEAEPESGTAESDPAAGAGEGEHGAVEGGTRELTDPRELRAMTHPVRLALLEVLNLHQALTATEAGELIGESPTTCSFHLRQLAKYGFVEEAGDAPGRRRPWRLATRGVRFSAASGDPEMGAASTALEGLLVQRWIERFTQWQRVRSHYPVEWQEAASAGEFLLHLTSAELLEIQKEVLVILERYHDRNADASLRPEASRPVEIVTFGYPYIGPER